MIKNIIVVLSLTLSLFFVSLAQADTIKRDFSQLSSDPLAAFNATADIGQQLSVIEADEMRGEAIPALLLPYIVSAYKAVTIVSKWLYGIFIDPNAYNAKSYIKSTSTGVVVNSVVGWVPLEYITTPAMLP